MTARGTLFTLSAPSGAGKTSLVTALLEGCTDVRVSVSHTTRPKRPGERNGEDYHFIEEAGFKEMLNNSAFLEHAQVFDHYYGTSSQWVEETLVQGVDVILEIDWQGASQVSRLVTDCVRIFILPPSLNSLTTRLTGRGQDEADVIARRVAQAQEEMSHYVESDYLIVNDDFDTALAQLRAIILAQRQRLSIQQDKCVGLLKELLSGKQLSEK